jgi:hypothetical protein
MTLITAFYGIEKIIINTNNLNFNQLHKTHYVII